MLPRSPLSTKTSTVVDFSRVSDSAHETSTESPPRGPSDSAVDRKTALPSREKTESTFETAEGTIHVKPFRKKGSKALKAVVTFIPRASAFDRGNSASGSDPFRGFFTLFWISVFLLSVKTYWDSFDSSGYPISTNFATLISKDMKTLFWSDLVLVGSTAIVVPFIKALQNGWIRYYWTGVALQHAYQTLMLAAAVAWTFNRQWPWVQSGFFTLHSLVMLMKVHSYCAVNGYYSSQQWVYEVTAEVLRTVCEEPQIGGWTTALAEATAIFNSKTAIVETPDEISSYDSTPSATPNLGSTSISPPAAILRNRLHSVQSEAHNNASADARSAPLPSAALSDGVHQHPLTYHPDRRVAELAQTLTELDAELSVAEGNGNTRGTRWPENVTLWNFMDYQLIPTLVYEMQYPRTTIVRPLYVLEKTVATFGTFTLLYTYTEHYIIPLTPQPGQPLIRSIIDLILPFMLCYLLLFYIIFECICNGFAEISLFADRQFYEDWWNSTTWDEYARKWNKPVHTFLLRHVYASTISSLKFSRGSAAFATFLLSALAHELVMAVVTQKIRLYLFLLQMAQLPLIALGRLPVIKRNKTIGNIVFWFGLLTGFPLLCVAYCAY